MWLSPQRHKAPEISTVGKGMKFTDVRETRMGARGHSTSRTPRTCWGDRRAPCRMPAGADGTQGRRALTAQVSPVSEDGAEAQRIGVGPARVWVPDSRGGAGFRLQPPQGQGSGHDVASGMGRGLMEAPSCGDEGARCCSRLTDPSGSPLDERPQAKLQPLFFLPVLVDE